MSSRPSVAGASWWGECRSRAGLRTVMRIVRPARVAATMRWRNIAHPLKCSVPVRSARDAIATSALLALHLLLVFFTCYLWLNVNKYFCRNVDTALAIRSTTDDVMARPLPARLPASLVALPRRAVSRNMQIIRGCNACLLHLLGAGQLTISMECFARADPLA